MLAWLLFLSVFSQQRDTPPQGVTPELVEREKLAFIERSVMSIFSKGSFPKVFKADTAEMSRCGCTHGASPVFWGLKVGMTCKLALDVRPDESCATRCITPKGEAILLLCPDGWNSDCASGCVPPSFDAVSMRADFLIKQVESIAANGDDYIAIDEAYLAQCTCQDARVRSINYGTKIGFDCVVEGDAGEACNGFNSCQNQAGETVMIFCPAGHRPECRGCVSTLEELATADEQYDWAIMFLTGFIRESQDILDSQPPSNKLVDCGCRSGLNRVEYGSQIGYFCQVGSVDEISPDCDLSHVLCENEQGTLIHFCPDGFVPDCGEGCTHWWKNEL